MKQSVLIFALMVSVLISCKGSRDIDNNGSAYTSDNARWKYEQALDEYNKDKRKSQEAYEKKMEKRQAAFEKKYGKYKKLVESDDESSRGRGTNSVGRGRGATTSAPRGTSVTRTTSLNDYDEMVVEEVHSDGTVTKILPQADFWALIKCTGSMTVKFKQSSECSVKVTAPEHLHDKMKVYTEVKCLYIGLDEDKISKKEWSNSNELKSKILVEVTGPCPVIFDCSGAVDAYLSDVNADNLRIIADGVARIYAGNITVDVLSVTKSGAATLETGFIDCSRGGCSIEAKGAGNITIKGDIKCKTFHISSGGAVKVNTGDIECKESAHFNNDGAASLQMNKIHASTILLTNSGAATFNSTYSTGDEFSVIQSGAGQATINFKGTKMKAINSGARTLNLNLECEQADISNSGASSVKVSGTADNVKIEGTGASSVDCSGLNAF